MAPGGKEGGGEVQTDRRCSAWCVRMRRLDKGASRDRVGCGRLVPQQRSVQGSSQQQQTQNACASAFHQYFPTNQPPTNLQTRRQSPLAPTPWVHQRLCCWVGWRSSAAGRTAGVCALCRVCASWLGWVRWGTQVCGWKGLTASCIADADTGGCVAGTHQLATTTNTTRHQNHHQNQTHTPMTGRQRARTPAAQTL